MIGVGDGSPSFIDSRKRRVSRVRLTPLKIAVVSVMLVQVPGTAYLCDPHATAVPFSSIITLETERRLLRSLAKSASMYTLRP